MKGFTNGSIVAKVFPDGSGDITAKFAYLSDAKRFADMCAKEDGRTCREINWLYLVLCEHEDVLEAFNPRHHIVAALAKANVND